MRIEFDHGKRQLTIENRGIDMARAGEVFAGPTFTFMDDRKSYGEIRRISVGLLDRRMVVLVWTQRGSARRIISMRKANDREQKIYQSRLG